MSVYDEVVLIATVLVEDDESTVALDQLELEPDEGMSIFLYFDHLYPEAVPACTDGQEL